MRFEGAIGGNSVVSNSAIYHGLGKGVQIANSANVVLTNNTIYDFVKFGFNVDTSQNLTIDGNWMILVRPRNLNAVSTGDPMAAFAICAFLLVDQCSDIVTTRNLAAGVASNKVDATGFSVYGHECEDFKNIVFKDNMAHSIDGTGAIIFRNPSKSSQS